MEKYLPQLDSTIGKGVQDANPEVRLNFRGVFSLYYKMHQGKAERIFASVDPSIKKLLSEEIYSGGVSSSEISSSSFPSNQRLQLTKSTSDGTQLSSGLQ